MLNKDEIFFIREKFVFFQCYFYGKSIMNVQFYHWVSEFDEKDDGFECKSQFHKTVYQCC